MIEEKLAEFKKIWDDRGDIGLTLLEINAFITHFYKEMIEKFVEELIDVRMSDYPIDYAKNIDSLIDSKKQLLEEIKS